MALESKCKKKISSIRRELLDGHFIDSEDAFLID
jgi:hypothetical protein